MAGELTRAKEVSAVLKDQPLRCWDDPFGCERQVDKHALRFHPRLCAACLDGLCLKFGVPRADGELLTLVLHLEASMKRTAKYFKADPAKLQTLEAGREQYIPQFLRTIKPLRNRHEIEAKEKAFRHWWFSQVGLEFRAEPVRAVKGFSTPAEVA